MAASQRRNRAQEPGSSSKAQDASREEAGSARTPDPTKHAAEPAKRRATGASATDATHEKAKDAVVDRRRSVSAERTGTGRRVAAPTMTPSWIAPVAVILLIVGLIYLVTYYLSSATLPLPIGDWNLLVGFGVLALGGVTLMFWK